MSAEDQIKNCYSTWGQSYYDDYYGQSAAYPPVHLDLVTRLIDERKPANLLDAGCGPGSMLRHLVSPGRELFGFDLTPEMVTEAKLVMAARGCAPSSIWQGSVTSLPDFSAPGLRHSLYDCVLSCGVMPHIPEDQDGTVIANIFASLKSDGLAIVEARNDLFAMFTMNRYTRDFFFQRLLDVDALRASADDEAKGLDAALSDVHALFRTDLPPIRNGKVSEPGYDEVLSRGHHPLELQRKFLECGFRNAGIYYYHFHALPPMVGSYAPKLFRRASLAMEANPLDWRGLFVASAFFIVAQR